MQKNYILFAVFLIFFLLRLGCLAFCFLFHIFLKRSHEESKKRFGWRCCCKKWKAQKKKQKPNRFLLLKHHFKRKTRAISWDERCYIVLFFFFVISSKEVFNFKFRFLLRCCAEERFSIFVSDTFYCLLIWFHYRWSVFMKTSKEAKEEAQKQFQRFSLLLFPKLILLKCSFI